MFNNDTFNSQVFNNTPLVVNPPLDDIIFNGYSLMTACENENGLGIIVQNENSRDLASINLSTYTSGQTDGGGVLNRRYANRILNLNLSFIQTSYDNLIALFDEFKKNTSVVEGLFEIVDGGIRRTAKATMTSFKPGTISINEVYQMDVPVVLEILDPNWTEKGGIVNSYFGITGDLLEYIFNSGTYITYPKFFLIFQTGTVGFTSLSILVNNVPITITENINVGDLVIYDGINKTVSLNGVNVDYDGFFQEYNVGNNSIEFNFTATSVNVDINNLYNNTYL